MRKHKKVYLILAVFLVLGMILGSIVYRSQDQELKVVFLDVGQGDAILISQGSRQVLIDGGPDGQVVLEKLGKYVPFWDRKIELLVATHPDSDHISGLIDVIKNYEVMAVLDSGAASDSQIYKKYQELITQKNIDLVPAYKGENIRLGDQADMEIINPQEEIGRGNQKGKETNLYSIVIRLNFGENHFLLSGDLPMEGEAGLAESNLDLHSQVLKIGHHGSKYSSGENFLEKVKPRDAIISVGRNNRYGHPAPEVLERLEARKINALRTDESGDISYHCPEPSRGCERSK